MKRIPIKSEDGTVIGWIDLLSATLKNGHLTAEGEITDPEYKHLMTRGTLTGLSVGLDDVTPVRTAPSPDEANHARPTGAD